MADADGGSGRIVIVGGVAGGASAAARARRMDEAVEIIMLEKDEHVSFANCGLPYYIGGEIEEREKLLVAKPARFRDWLNVEVRTRSEATAIDRDAKSITVMDHRRGASYELGYDKLILAPGAAPIVPPIEGVDSSNVFTLRNVADTDAIKGYIDGNKPGRVAALEILVNTSAVANLIRQGKLDQLETAMQSGTGAGMQTMDMALLELYEKGVISGDDAYLQANNKSKFREYRESGGPDLYANTD